MRRLGRRTLNALTVLSLLLCVAAMGSWAWSYFGHTWVYLNTGRRSFDDTLCVSIGQGGIDVGEVWTGSGEFLLPRMGKLSVERDVRHKFYPTGDGLVRGDDVGLIFGFGFRRQTESLPWHPGATADFWSVVAPIWSVMAASALLPLYSLARRRRVVAGHCHSCSYDLTSNVSGICPECGTNLATSPNQLPPAN